MWSHNRCFCLLSVQCFFSKYCKKSALDKERTCLIILQNQSIGIWIRELKASFFVIFVCSRITKFPRYFQFTGHNFSCHEPWGNCHEPRGNCHEPWGNCHEPWGNCHEPWGNCCEKNFSSSLMFGHEKNALGCCLCGWLLDGRFHQGSSSSFEEHKRCEDFASVHPLFFQTKFFRCF